MLEAIIFDLDNTLVSTKIEYIQSLLKKVLKKDVSKEEAINFWNKGNYMEISDNKFWEKYVKYDDPNERIKYTDIYEDTVVLKDIYNKKIKLGIVTNASPQITKLDVKLIENKLNIKFDYAISCNSDFTNINFKPDPEGLLLCILKLDVNKENVIYVGDHKTDKLTAENAGVKYFDRNNSLKKLIKLI